MNLEGGGGGLSRKLTAVGWIDGGQVSMWMAFTCVGVFPPFCVAGVLLFACKGILVALWERQGRFRLGYNPVEDCDMRDDGVATASGDTAAHLRVEG